MHQVPLHRAPPSSGGWHQAHSHAWGQGRLARPCLARSPAPPRSIPCALDSGRLVVSAGAGACISPRVDEIREKPMSAVRCGMGQLPCALLLGLV